MFGVARDGTVATSVDWAVGAPTAEADGAAAKAAPVNARTSESAGKRARLIVPPVMSDLPGSSGLRAASGGGCGDEFVVVRRLVEQFIVQRPDNWLHGVGGRLQQVVPGKV